MDDVEDLVLDIAWRDYDLCFSDKTNLENKVNIILVINGVLIGLILTSINNINKQFGILAFVLLLISTLFCLISIYLRDYKYLNAMKTWTDFENDNITTDTNQAKKNVFATVNHMVIFNRTNYDKMAFWVKLAIIIAIISIIIVGISLVINQEWFMNYITALFQRK
jgi:purine-cytosine permease-like protein